MLSLTPAVYGNPNAQLFSTTFNATLASGLASVTGVTIFGLDLYALVNQTVANRALRIHERQHPLLQQPDGVCDAELVPVLGCDPSDDVAHGRSRMRRCS